MRIRSLLDSWKQQDKLAAVLLSLAILGMACLSFPGSECLILVWGPGLFCLLVHSWQKLYASRQHAREEKEFAYFLSYLASAVTTGRNLELSLAEAAQKLGQDLPEKGRLHQAVQKLSLSLYAGLGLRQSLEEFSRQFSHASIKTFARVLATLVENGGRFEIYLQLQRDALQKNLELEAELKAELAASLTEASVMSVLPFLISWALNQSSYLQDLSHLAAWPYLQSSFLVLAVLGLTLALRMIREGLKVEKFPNLSLARLPPNNWGKRFSKAWARLLAQAYPAELHRKALYDLSSFGSDPSQLWEKFTLKKLRFGLVALIFALLVTRSLLGLGLAILAFFYPDAQLREAAKSLARSEQAGYPVFLNLLAILLESSLSLERSLALALLCLLPEPQPEASGRTLRQRSKKSMTVLQHDLLEVKQELESGLGASEVLENLADKSRQAEIAQTLHLITRYAREGSENQVALLRLQAQRTQDHYRNSMREILAKKGLRILLPMAYDLILVISISVLPALMQLHI